jgi:hypothetical protein
MPVDCVDSFLIHPGRGKEDQVQLSGIRLPTKGQLFNMLGELFDRANKECKIDIIFRTDDPKKQENPCRTLLVDHLKQPSLKSGHSIAERLAHCTGNRSGLGLLFIVCGKAEGLHRLVLARFPADQGVLAEEKGSKLEIEFVEKVFMKSAKSYKSVVYWAKETDNGFWRGRAVDKQINGPREVSEYWIGDFLASDLATTGAAGTRRLGNALRAAARATASDEVRAQLISAAQLIPAHAGKKMTARSLLDRIGVSGDGIKEVERAMERKELMDERFQIDKEEFEKAAAYKAVELDNGALLMADTGRFENIFHTRQVAENRVRYETEGKIVKQSIRKAR